MEAAFNKSEIIPGQKRVNVLRRVVDKYGVGYARHSLSSDLTGGLKAR